MSLVCYSSPKTRPYSDRPPPPPSHPSERHTHPTRAGACSPPHNFARPSFITDHSFNLPVAAPPARPVHLARLASGLPPSDGTTSQHARAEYAHTPLWSPSNEHWSPLSAPDFQSVIRINALEGGYIVPKEEGGNKGGERASIAIVKPFTILREDASDSAAEEWRKWLLKDLGVTVRDKTYTYADLCFGADCAGLSAPQLEPHPLHSDQVTLNLVLRAPAPGTPTITYLERLARLPTFTAPSTNTTVRVLPPAVESPRWGFFPNLDGGGLFSGLAEKKGGDDQITVLRNLRWFAHALRALVLRFYTLAKVSRSRARVEGLALPITALVLTAFQNADSADVFVVLLGYVLMHASFVKLFMNMRKLGSHFWLGEYSIGRVTCSVDKEPDTCSGALSHSASPATFRVSIVLTPQLLLRSSRLHLPLSLPSSAHTSSTCLSIQSAYLKRSPSS